MTCGERRRKEERGEESGSRCDVWSERRRRKEDEVVNLTVVEAAYPK